MKKICILLAMLFAVTCLPAMAAEGDAMLGLGDEEQLSFNYCFSQGDTLYLAGYSDLYAYRVGDADLTQYTFVSPEMGDGFYEIATLPFADGDRLYALNLITDYGENTQFAGANITEIALQGDEVKFGDSVDVDWSDMLEYYEDSTYPIRPDYILGAGGKAIVHYYSTNGDYMMAAVDLSTGALTQIDTLSSAYLVTGYRDGMVLVEQYSYESNLQTAQLLAYDPGDDSTQRLGEIQVSEYSPLVGLAYDAASDILYCVKGGEICPVDLQAGEVGAGITDMPLASYGSAAGSILEGGYYAYCSEGAAIRSLDISQQAQTRLKISDSSWNDAVSNAYYRFSNAHGDINVVLSRDYSESENLVERMMNHDDDVDVYIVYSMGADYDALYNRGYLMELDGSPKVAELAERMYPALREDLSTNGHLVALPISMNAWSLGVNEKALAAMGLKLEDVPDDWPGFLDFLAGLKDVAADSGIHLFYSGYTARDARNDLFNLIFDNYQQYVTHTEPQTGYNTELLRGLLEKLEQLDLVALGCLEDDASEDEVFGMVDYNEDTVLLQTYVGSNIGNFYSDFTPVLMRMEPGAPNWLTLDTTVAIVNPYTKNPEAALAFIDEMVDSVPRSVLYCLDPTMNETIRGDMNQETLDEEVAQLEALRAEYETASAEDKQSLEQEISDHETNLEYFENFLWEISPAEVAWYRSHDENLAIGRFSWLYGADGAGEATELIERYRDGQISAGEMLEGIDKKVQMMLLEGN